VDHRLDSPKRYIPKISTDCICVKYTYICAILFFRDNFRAMKRILLIWIPCLTVSLIVRAQEKKDTTQLLSEVKNTSRSLSEVVVTYQANQHTPVTYQNLNMKVLEQKNTGQEPSFLLSETPSITVYSDAGNQQGYSYYRLRGMDQTRVNTTLDGMPLNEPEDQGAYFSNYPDILNSVSRIQIQRGVGTSKNGAASYAGSVELFSPDLRDSTYGAIGAGYGSYNSYRIFGEYNTGVKNHKALYVRASDVSTDGYKYNAFNHSQSVFISGGLFYDKSTWKLNVMAGHQQNGMAWLGVADTLIAKDPRSNADTKAEKDHFFQGLVQLENIFRLSEHSTISSSVYYTFLKGGYGFDGNNYIGLPSDGDLFHYNFLSHFPGLYTNYTLSYDHVKWTTGVHGSLYQREHRGVDDVQGQLYDNTGYKKEISAFTKVEYSPGSSGRFNLFADLQYRAASFDYKGDVPFEKMKWNFFNPKAGVSFLLSHPVTLYYTIGKTSREPTRNDIFGGNDNLTADSTGKAIIYNRDAETVVDQELGLRFSHKQLAFSVNGYYMSFQHEIVLNGQVGPNGLLLTNEVKSSYRTGVELSASYRLGALLFTNNSSFNHSRIKEQSTTFSPVLTPNWIVFQEVAYEHKNFLVAVSGRYQSSSYIDFANDADIKGYWLMNGRVAYNMKHYTLSFFVNNITSAKYFNNAYVDYDGTKKYSIQAPGNIYFAIKYSF
jgi:iron complex outermembrane recepter protein